MNKTLEIEYLSGKVTGVWGRELVYLGELSFWGNLGLATKIEVPILDDVKWDGIVGLGFANNKMKQINILPVMDSII